MFQQKQIEEYQNITAPTELKDRVKFSVSKARRTMRQKMIATAALAASIALFCVSGSLFEKSSTILLVNNVVVRREALLIENQDAIPLTAKEGQQRSLPVSIPIEMEVKGKAELAVNVGSLIQELDANQYSEETTRLEISENVKVYWILDGVLDESPVCTVKNGRKTDKYVVEYQIDTQCYTIKKVN